jgi:hypothetical protein
MPGSKKVTNSNGETQRCPFILWHWHIFQYNHQFDNTFFLQSVSDNTQYNQKQRRNERARTAKRTPNKTIENIDNTGSTHSAVVLKFFVLLLKFFLNNEWFSTDQSCTQSKEWYRIFWVGEM